MMNSKSSGNGGGGRGGLFPPSNLSPLAPPFTVDRSASVSRSLSNSFGNSTESVRARNLFSPNPYQFSASESVSTQTAHIPAVSDLPLVTPDLYSYRPFSRGDNELGYEMLSNFFAGLVNETSHGDYEKNLSGLEYPTQWVGFLDLESGNWLGADESSGMEEATSVAGLSGPMTLPAYDMLSNSVAGLVNESSHGDYENWLGATSAGFSVYRDYVGQGCAISEGLRTSNEASGTVYYPPKPRRENNTGSLCVKCLNESTRIIVIRPPDAGCVPSVSNISLRQENSLREPDQSTEDKAHLERNGDHIDNTFSSKYEETGASRKTSTKDASDRFVRASSEPQVPPIIERGKLKSIHDSSEAVSSGEDPSKNLDHGDLSVDSPCWKGATNSRFTPLQYLEAASNFILMEDEETSCSSFEGHPVFPHNTDDSVRVFSEKVSDQNAYYDNGSLQNASPPSLIPPIAVNPPGESRPNVAGKEESSCLESDPRTQDGCALPNSSECDENSKSGHTVKPSIGEVVSEETQTTGISMDDTAQDGSSAVPVVQPVPGSLFGEDGSTNLREVCREERAPSIDLHRLVMTMCNLSELFLHHSSHSACMLSENDHVALCHIINNLNVFVSSNDEEMIPPQQLPQPGASVFLEQSPLEERSVERPISRVNADLAQQDSMAKEIKKVLAEKFYVEDETHPQVLLYKNLWLETEAALCSLTSRARLERLKTEMGSSLELKAPEFFLPDSDTFEISAPRPEPEDSSMPNAAFEDYSDNFNSRFQSLNQANVEEPSTTGVRHPSHDLTNGSPYMLPRTESFPPSLGIQGDDVDDSVMGRFKTLKCRIDCSGLDEQEMMKAPDLGFRGNASLVRGELEGAIFDPYMECSMEHHAIVPSEGGLFGNSALVPKEELYARARNARRRYLLARRGASRPNGSHQGSSSDWEHA